MKAIEINGNIKTFRRLPNVWEDESGLHLNFRKVADPTEFGFYDVVTPQYDKISERLSAMYFDGDRFTYDVVAIDLEGTHDVLDEDGNVIETKPNYDIAELKASKIQAIKTEAGKLLTPTDWYITRLAERVVEIPQEIKDERADIIAKSDTFEIEINALTTVEEVLRYKHAFYPAPALDEVEPISE
jgi:HJR/Mrr/RecB family endonuclease